MRAQLSPASGTRNEVSRQDLAPYPVGTSRAAATVNLLVVGLLRHWLLILNIVLGVFVGLPWLAPLLMRLGLEGPASLIYRLYGLFCHQLPERSWFLFGRSFTYPLAEITRLTGANFFALHQFAGNPEMGWKLAWSDRMVSFYGGWFVFGLVYALVRSLRPGWRGLRWQTAVLLLLPMFIDGISHAVSDLWGIDQGFRAGNLWLAVITGNLLPGTFYRGDAWGSFNSLARLITGLMAAAGIMLWLLPRMNKVLNQDAALPITAGMVPGMPVMARQPVDNSTNIPTGR